MDNVLDGEGCIRHAHHTGSEDLIEHDGVPWRYSPPGEVLALLCPHRPHLPTTDQQMLGLIGTEARALMVATPGDMTPTPDPCRPARPEEKAALGMRNDEGCRCPASPGCVGTVGDSPDPPTIPACRR